MGDTTDLQGVPELDDAQISKYKNEITRDVVVVQGYGLAVRAKSITVTDQVGAENATEMLGMLKRARGMIVERVAFFSAPAKKFLEMVKGLSAEPLGEIDAADTHLRRQITVWQDAEQAKRDSAQRALDAAERKRNEELAAAETAAGRPAPPPVSAWVRPAPKTVESPTAMTTRRSIPDQDKIADAVEAGVREIPGVEITQVWVFKVTDSALVPAEYRKASLQVRKGRLG